VFGLLNWLLGPEAEARRLNKDAAYIVQALEDEHYGPQAGIGAIARDLRGDIDYAFETFIGKGPDAGKAYGHVRAEDQLQRMHREATRGRDQQALSALTLALIYVRADRLGPPAAAARASIDQFLVDWGPTETGDRGPGTE